MTKTDDYASALIARLEDKGDGLSREAATFIRAERSRIAGYKKLLACSAGVGALTAEKAA